MSTAKRQCRKKTNNVYRRKEHSLFKHESQFFPEQVTWQKHTPEDNRQWLIWKWVRSFWKRRESFWDQWFSGSMLRSICIYIYIYIEYRSTLPYLLDSRLSTFTLLSQKGLCWGGYLDWDTCKILCHLEIPKIPTSFIKNVRGHEPLDEQTQDRGDSTITRCWEHMYSPENKQRT